MPELPRRRALQALAGGAVGTLAGCLGDLAFSSSSNDPPIGNGVWPQARADARNNGTSEAATIPANPSTHDWTFERAFSEDTGYALGALGPVIGDGTLYTAVIRPPTDAATGEGGATETTAAGTGTSDTPPGTTHGGPASEPPGRMAVYAVDTATGEVDWRTDIDVASWPPSPNEGMVLSDTGLHIVARAPDEDEIRYELLSLDRSDGAVRDRRPGISGLTAGPTLLYGRERADEELSYVGVDPESHEVDWRVPVGEAVAPGFTVDSERLVGRVWEEDSSSEQSLIAWSLDDAGRRWESNPIRRGLEPHSVGAGTVVGTAKVRGGGRVVGLDVEDGSRQFSHDVDQHPLLGPTIVGRMALIVGANIRDERWVLHGVDLSTGELRYSEVLDVRIASTPVSDGERVLISGGGVTVVDPEDGSTLWSLDYPGKPEPRSTAIEDSLAHANTIYPGDGRLFGVRDEVTMGSYGGG